MFYRFVRLDFAREIDCVPDRGIFRPEPKDGKTACLSIAHRVQLVQKTGDIEEPDRVFLVGILVIKIRIVIGRRDRPRTRLRRCSRGSSLREN